MKLTKKNLADQLKEVKIEPVKENEMVIPEPLTDDHEYIESFYMQQNFEERRFLWFNYKKLIGKQKIPVELCQICNKLKIQHYA